MVKKDFSLLRPFDLEAAKRGDILCDGDEANFYEFLGNGSDCSPPRERLAIKLIRSDYNDASGLLYLCDTEHVRMAPLTWVEGCPVYRGDVLYETIGSGAGRPYIVASFANGRLIDDGSKGMCHEYNPELLTWTPPKVKREGWVNVQARRTTDTAWVEEINGLLSQSYASKEAADKYALAGRTACVRIEWEE